jgi:TRAP-type C4-dicarboxylate transport system substrate-binding protein
MKSAKFALVLILGLVLVAGVFAAGGGQKPAGGAAAAPTKFTIGGTNGPTDTQSMGHVEYAKRLNALGGWNADAKTSSELGSTDDMTEQAINGAPIATSSDPSRIAVYVPDIGILMMPYMFSEYSQVDSLMETPLYKEWVQKLRGKGVVLLTNNSLTGWRNWVTNKPIKVPEDLKGQKIRTMGNPIAINSVEAMGAVPIAMAQDQAYHAISTRVVDGGEWQLPTIYSLKLYEVAKHISLSRHFLLLVSIVTGTKWFDTLSPQQQKELTETAVKTYKDNQAIVVDYENKYLSEMETKYGVTVERNPDREAFKKASAHLYADPKTNQGADYQGIRTELYKQLGIAP